ncbi:PLD nuclease N-terminal domain-containing protein [Microbacterium sp. NPDC096154]|uniref:PLD nuclease N-terminal domain-containing protein n=1 Tax=Microbacterium sp. NPDC096154 TaxID=3155549 RepID=UPI0033168F75
MARLLIVLGIAAAVFWVFSIVDCAVQPPARHRGVSKGAWIAIVVLIPVLGGILWFVLGRARPQAPGRVIAPDDDPNFLGTLRAPSDQDERIRLLEEELARLDSEGDDPRTRPDQAEPTAPDDDEPGADDDPRGRRGGAL